MCLSITRKGSERNSNKVQQKTVTRDSQLDGPYKPKAGLNIPGFQLHFRQKMFQERVLKGLSGLTSVVQQ